MHMISAKRERIMKRLATNASPSKLSFIAQLGFTARLSFLS